MLVVNGEHYSKLPAQLTHALLVHSVLVMELKQPVPLVNTVLLGLLLQVLIVLLESIAHSDHQEN